MTTVYFVSQHQQQTKEDVWVHGKVRAAPRELMNPSGGEGEGTFSEEVTFSTISLVGSRCGSLRRRRPALTPVLKDTKENRKGPCSHPPFEMRSFRDHQQILL